MEIVDKYKKSDLTIDMEFAEKHYGWNAQILHQIYGDIPKWRDGVGWVVATPTSETITKKAP